MWKYLTATTITWASVHVVLVLIGLLIMNIDYAAETLGLQLAMGLGVSIMSAGVVGLFLFLYVALTETMRARLQALSNAGIAMAFNSRSVRIKEEYDRRLNKATRIDVVGYGLGSFLEDYSREFSRWSKKARVRIIAIDPDSPAQERSYADARDQEEGRIEGKTRADVEQLIRTVSEDDEIDVTRFEVRLMSAIPSVNVMIIDDEAFWGPYLLNEQSRNTFTITAHRGGYIFDALEAHFNHIWSKYSRSPQPTITEN